jgi:hypothetical protein
MTPPAWVLNLQRIHQIRQEAAGDDAETLARLFEDEDIVSGDGVGDRIEAILAATEHHWIRGMRTIVDMPGLYECKGFSDRGFREEFRDPWPCSRDQVGHILTAVGLTLHPEKVESRKLGRRVRDWVRAPAEMSNEEVVIRLVVGHEKEPDPRIPDPLVLVKVRRQFDSATDGDVAAFRRARAALELDGALDLDRLAGHLAGVQVGQGRGNSVQDLYLSFAGYLLAHLIKAGHFSTRHEVAGWVRQNLKAQEQHDAETSPAEPHRRTRGG